MTMLPRPITRPPIALNIAQVVGAEPGYDAATAAPAPNERPADSDVAWTGRVLVWFVIACIIVVVGAIMVMLFQGLLWLVARLTMVIAFVAVGWLIYLTHRIKDLERRLDRADPPNVTPTASIPDRPTKPPLTPAETRTT